MRMLHKTCIMSNVKVGIELNQAFTYELSSIVGYNSMWNPILPYYNLSHELFHLLGDDVWSRLQKDDF